MVQHPPTRPAQDLQGTQVKSDVWNALQDHWKLYQNKHYARDDNQVEELMEAEEECEASDKNDCRIAIPDGDEIDDVEEASVDDDSPPPRLHTSQK